MILIFFSELNLRGVLRLIALTTDSGLLLVLGSFRPSFQNFDYNLKPSIYYTLIRSTFLWNATLMEIMEKANSALSQISEKMAKFKDTAPPRSPPSFESLNEKEGVVVDTL